MHKEWNISSRCSIMKVNLQMIANDIEKFNLKSISISNKTFNSYTYISPWEKNHQLEISQGITDLGALLWRLNLYW